MDTPLGDFFNDDGIREFERNHSYCFEIRSDAALLAHRERPYNGQPHTDHGERGKQLVHGVTMRDIADCIARGMRQACRNEDELNSCPFSVEAGIQNTMCNVEIMMGIFPNIPKLNDSNGDSIK
jgi:hypothetical protein